MRKDVLMALLVVFVVVAYSISDALDNVGGPAADIEPVKPNWSAIAAWPAVEVPDVEAQPDPNRRITAIVLDDSGSMERRITEAKSAVVAALEAMADEDRVAVVALNAGTVLAFRSVAEARQSLPNLLDPIRADGSTPLARSVRTAQDLLAAEAARVRGFGTFRLIVTTDGQADDDAALNKAIARLARRTPIQLTTIGINLGGRHVLKREDLGSFVDVANVSVLTAALQAAVAENTNFAAITNF